MKTKTIILLFLIIFLTAYFTISKAQTEFQNKEWAALEYPFYLDFKADSLIIVEYGEITYKGTYSFDLLYLKYGNESFEVHRGLVEDTYYLINDRRIIVLHENKDKTIKYW